MKALMILNDAPYGTERTYNGLRLALKLLQKAGDSDLTVFLMGDAVASANAGHVTPNGDDTVERMLKGVVMQKGKVLLCGSCMDARGLRAQDLTEGCRRSTLEELTELTINSDKTVIF